MTKVFTNSQCHAHNISLLAACEEELIQKYGEGGRHVRKCDTCHYEQVIHSAGVHVSPDGSIKVYAEPDEFSCPNCEQEGVDEVHEGKLLDHFKKQLNSRSYMYLNLHGRGNYFENLRI